MNTETLIPVLAQVLLHACWQIILIAGACALLLQLCRRARWRYGVALAGHVLIVVGLLTTAWRSWPAAMPPVLASEPASLVLASDVHAELPTFAAPVQESTPPVGLALAATPSAFPWQHLLVGAWAVGLLVLAARFVVGYRQVQGLCETAEVMPVRWRRFLIQHCRRLRLRRPRLLLSAGVHVPCVSGYRRPMILFPRALLKKLPAAQVEALLLHELAHIERRDLLIDLVAQFVTALVYFHPGIWYLRRELVAARECCCDDRALAAGAQRQHFAEALLAVAQRLSPAPAALGSGGGRLHERISRVLGAERRSQRDPAGLAWGSILVLIVLGLSVIGVPGGASEADAAVEELRPPPVPAKTLAQRLEMRNSEIVVESEIQVVTIPAEVVAALNLSATQPSVIRDEEGLALLRPFLARPTVLTSFPHQLAPAAFIHQQAYVSGYEWPPQPGVEPVEMVDIASYGRLMEISAAPGPDGVITIDRASATVTSVRGFRDAALVVEGKRYPFNEVQMHKRLALLHAPVKFPPGAVLCVPLVETRPLSPETMRARLERLGFHADTMISYVVETGDDEDRGDDFSQLNYFVVSCRPQPRRRAPTYVVSEPDALRLQAVRVSLRAEDAPLSEVLAQLALQLPVPIDLTFDADVGATRVSCDATDEALVPFLRGLLAQTLLQARLTKRALELRPDAIKDFRGYVHLEATGTRRSYDFGAWAPVTASEDPQAPHRWRHAKAPVQIDWPELIAQVVGNQDRAGLVVQPPLAGNPVEVTASVEAHASIEAFRQRLQSVAPLARIRLQTWLVDDALLPDLIEPQYPFTIRRLPAARWQDLQQRHPEAIAAFPVMEVNDGSALYLQSQALPATAGRCEVQCSVLSDPAGVRLALHAVSAQGGEQRNYADCDSSAEDLLLVSGQVPGQTLVLRPQVIAAGD